MNFLGMGPMELMMILVLALIVFGPSKLPEMAGQVGKAVRDFRRATSELSGEFNRTLSLEVEERKSTGAAAPPAEPAPVAAAEPIVATPTVVAPPVATGAVANGNVTTSSTASEAASTTPTTSIAAPLSSQPLAAAQAYGADISGSTGGASLPTAGAVAEPPIDSAMPSTNGAATNGASARSKRTAARRPIDSELVPPY